MRVKRGSALLVLGLCGLTVLVLPGGGAPQQPGGVGGIGPPPALEDRVSALEGRVAALEDTVGSLRKALEVPRPQLAVAQLGPSPRLTPENTRTWVDLGGGYAVRGIVWEGGGFQTTVYGEVVRLPEAPREPGRDYVRLNVSLYGLDYSGAEDLEGGGVVIVPAREPSALFSVSVPSVIASQVDFCRISCFPAGPPPGR